MDVQIVAVSDANHRRRQNVKWKAPFARPLKAAPWLLLIAHFAGCSWWIPVADRASEPTSRMDKCDSAFEQQPESYVAFAVQTWSTPMVTGLSVQRTGLEIPTTNRT